MVDDSDVSISQCTTNVNPYQTTINLAEIPIISLRTKSRNLLSVYLNPIKILPSEDGLPRDWRGVFHCSKLATHYGPHLSNKSDQMEELLNIWCADKENVCSLAQLQHILGCIDRWDVLDDTMELFLEDATEYIKNKAKHNRAITRANDSSSEIRNISNPELNILTIDDVKLAHQGLPLQIYDAFILFADEDIGFATEMINKLEDCSLKICVKERDLLGGINFEHDAIRRLLTERCNRLIVILSPSFLESPANAFIANLAQSLGIAQRKRKIIPCLYEPCELPEIFHHIHLLNYQRAHRLFNFWDKLKHSLVNTPDEFVTGTCPRITITDDSCSVPSQAQTIMQAITVPALMTLPSRRSHRYSTPEARTVTPEAPALHTPSSPSSNESRSSPSTPLSIRSIKLLWPSNISDRSNSTQSLNEQTVRNNSFTSMESTSKKRKWYKKLLTTSHSFKLYDSDNELNPSKDANKKKMWFRKKIPSHS